MFDLIDSSKKPSHEPKETTLTIEERLTLCLEKMQESLEQKQEPNLSQFWQAKKECVLLFKEKISPQKRNQFWQKYIKLSDEGRIVRDFLDEEALFAIEQIELAIVDVEKQFQLIEESKCTIQLEFPRSPQAFIRIYDSCCNLQNLIQQAQLLAIRLQELRKEISIMSMRMKIKGRFFDRLSLICDKLFPKRNEMIAQLSELFFQTVQDFVRKNFSENHQQLKRNCYFLQNEIREIQAVAKLFSLSTKVFAETRKELSRCWDQLKEIEKEKKEDFSQMKEQSDSNSQKIEKMIQELSEEKDLSEKEVMSRLKEIQKEMQGSMLLRKQIAILEKKCELIAKPFEEAKEKAKEELREKRKQALLLEEQNVKAFLDKLVLLQQSIPSESLDITRSTIHNLEASLTQLECADARKKMLKQRLKEVMTAFAQVEEKALLFQATGSQEDQKRLSLILESKIAQREKLKAFLEECRKERGKSCLDFQKAIELSEKIEKGKAELQALEQSILDFDNKIDSFI